MADHDHNRPPLPAYNTSWHPALRSHNSDTNVPQAEDVQPEQLDQEVINGKGDADQARHPQFPLAFDSSPAEASSPIESPHGAVDPECGRGAASYEHHADATEADYAVEEAPTSALLADTDQSSSTPIPEATIPQILTSHADGHGPPIILTSQSGSAPSSARSVGIIPDSDLPRLYYDPNLPDSPSDLEYSPSSALTDSTAGFDAPSRADLAPLTTAGHYGQNLHPSSAAESDFPSASTNTSVLTDTDLLSLTDVSPSSYADSDSGVISGTAISGTFFGSSAVDSDFPAEGPPSPEPASAFGTLRDYNHADAEIHHRHNEPLSDRSTDSSHKANDVTSAATDDEDSFARMLAQGQTEQRTAQESTTGTDNLDALWEAALGDDDDDDNDDFLEEMTSALNATATANANLNLNPDQRDLATNSAAVTAMASTDRYRPANPTPDAAAAPYANQYQPTTPFLPAQANTFAPPVPPPSMTSMANMGALQRPTNPSSSKSFVDQAKSGYASPYDLPVDIVQPRKKPLRQASQPVSSISAPPPRTSSVTSAGMAYPLPQHPNSGYAADASVMPSHNNFPTTSRLPLKNQASTPSFFEDLPVGPKLRVRSSTSGGNVQGPGMGPAIDNARPPLHSSQSSYASPPARMPSSNSVYHPPPQALAGLQQPARMPLIPNEPPLLPQSPPRMPSRYTPSAANQGPSPPSFGASAPPPEHRTSRYSPASQMAQASQPQPVSLRYTPPRAAVSTSRAQPSIPRTSSPLAITEPPAGFSRRVSERQDSQGGIHEHSFPHEILAPYQSAPPPPNKTSPRHVPGPVMGGMSPPMRSRTQSPSFDRTAPSAMPSQVERPSAKSSQTGRRASNVGYVQPQPATQRQTNQPIKMPHGRKFSSEISFAIPKDERAHDHLERWKGCPIFRWSPNGVIVSSFPKQTPFYTTGQTIPTVKCSSGPIVIHDNKSTFPIDPCNARFPGPLNTKGKGKTKELLAWLTEKIADLEKRLQQAVLELSLPLPLKTRAEEKIILWKAVKLLVEQENVLEGKPEVGRAVQGIMVSETPQAELRSPITRPPEHIPKYFAPSETLAGLRRLLSQGKREDAVWYAVERSEWSHAIMIATTLDPSVWKQVTQEFVKSQVKDRADETEPLAALYEIFAGNWEESIDALVPPSARAGLQMMNRRASVIVGGNKDPLQGLEQWRETLSLIMNNRSQKDGQAIAALGRLLASYGRVEAAHTCYVFARSFVNHGGRDEPDVAFVLLGADHHDQRIALGADLDSILLSEVLEYASTLAPAAGVSHVIPHLQSYKLLHAYQLAEHGMRSEALAYCDAIVAAIKSTTKPSPYYHPAFTNSIEELSRCLSQSPQTGSSSGWVSKMSSDKVSGSMWKRFNTFVSGDDSDPATNGGDLPEGAGASPFARVTGDTPSVSRTPSKTDLYAAMSNGFQNSPRASTSPLKYSSHAGNGVKPDYGPPVRYGSVVSSAARPDMIDRSATMQPGQFAPRHMQRLTSDHAPQTGSQLENHHLQRLNARPEAVRAASDYHIPYNYNPPATDYVQGSSLVASEPVSSESSPFPQASPLHFASAYQPMAAPGFQQYDPARGGEGYVSSPGYSTANETASSHDPALSSVEPVSAESREWEAPQASQYQPYMPDEQGNEDDGESGQMPRSAASSNDEPTAGSSGKSAADREADERFRQAAEADTQRAKAEAEAKAKKGWIPGWLRGGGKDKDAAPGPIRAKLGEENSFYFDKELNKWVNKKAGADQQQGPSPTPPPPRATPKPAAGMGLGGPPSSGPPSRVSSGMALNTMAPHSGPPSPLRPATRTGTPGTGLEGPSRPGTSVSMSSSIDDLLSVGPRNKGGTVKGKKKGGRYVDVMAK